MPGSLTATRNEHLLGEGALGASFLEEASMLFRRALPVLLVIWGSALFGVAVLDWAGYGVVLQLLVLSR